MATYTDVKPLMMDTITESFSQLLLQTRPVSWRLAMRSQVRTQHRAASASCPERQPQEHRNPSRRLLPSRLFFAFELTSYFSEFRTALLPLIFSFHVSLCHGCLLGPAFTSGGPRYLEN